MMSTSTYGQRSISSSRVPGVLIDGLSLTLSNLRALYETTPTISPNQSVNSLSSFELVSEKCLQVKGRVSNTPPSFSLQLF